ncbi:hypothetical protein [Pontibacter russatus]|uniref:hypothetical protein n=1 Tax=Pontibacter russatus TaxID=2694929 RepID=UPI00192A3D98|nr:hypothetical protein [Pontibacter russatus]
MKIVAQTLLSAAFLGMVACSAKEQKETITTAPLNLPTAAPVADTASGAVAGLNPAHGQPGHRCDIPVGASLSLPVQPNLNAQPTVTPPPTQGAVAGLNPPHGQPGHSCAIPVGAPLN